MTRKVIPKPVIKWSTRIMKAVISVFKVATTRKVIPKPVIKWSTRIMKAVISVFKVATTTQGGVTELVKD
jgi:hypothetical protein